MYREWSGCCAASPDCDAAGLGLTLLRNVSSSNILCFLLASVSPTIISRSMANNGPINIDRKNHPVALLPLLFAAWAMQKGIRKM